MSFAAVLRRSKFVSYDPAISQVYTTHGGDAHRGNWGLKRPLALRRRQAFITLRSVDSREQQTEWNYGEGQVRFVRRWEELGVDARYSETSQWSQRVGSTSLTDWPVDSEFAPAQSSSTRPVDSQAILPNVHAMTPSQFDRYLKKLRSLRPAFAAYVAEKKPGKSLYELAQNSLDDLHIQFLAQHTAEKYTHPTSRAIEQRPHRTGGLSYAHPSALETRLTIPAQPGLVLQRHPERSPGARRGSAHLRETFFASYAGFLATLLRQDAAGRVPVLDLSSPRGVQPSRVSNSVTRLRLRSQPRLSAGPRVVGRAADDGLWATRMDVEVSSDDKTQFGRPNPHVPGSRDYNAVAPPPEQPTGGRARPMARITRRSSREYRQAAGSLMDAIMGGAGKWRVP